MIFSQANSAYQSAANYGRVAAASRHGLIAMLFEGAVERIARARGCIDNRDYVGKAQLLNRAVAIIDELRASLDLDKGGELASNLYNLYEYMCRQLLQATVDNDTRKLDEVLTLLNQIRSAWVELQKLRATGS